MQLRNEEDRTALTFSMRLSLAVGVLMLIMKMSAYLITGSAAILSDAAESVVHIVAVGFAYYSIHLSYKPADESHLYGHAKIGFFSAGFEGAMIVIAAVYIIYEAVVKWLSGLHIENLGLGSIITAAATVINGVLGWYLVHVGKKRKSLVLEANGKHVLTDSWTSLGVLVGLVLTLLTGWLPWDPVFAILVALNILYSGFDLIKRSISGLMDSAEPQFHKELIRIIEEETTPRAVEFHNVRHRNMGDYYWIEMHLLFRAETTIQEAHKLATEIEENVKKKLDHGAYISTHLESVEDHHYLHGEGMH